MDAQITNFLSIIKCALHGGVPELKEPDWEKLCLYAKQHSVIPLFFEGLQSIELPEELSARLMLSSVHMVSLQAARTDAFLDIYSKLLAGGVEPIVLKGIICRETYGDLGDHRPSGDEDIWIKKEEFHRCKEILEACGCRQEKVDVPDSELDTIQEISFENPETGVYIEVHFNIIGVENEKRAKMNSFFENSAETRRRVEINGQTVYTLNHTDHFIFLFLHFYKHISGAGVGIRQIADIMMYRTKYGNEVDWDKFSNVIGQLSAQKLFADITHIANNYLGFSLDPFLPPTCPDVLLEDIISAGVFGLVDRNHAVSAQMMMAVAGGNSKWSRFLSAVFPPANRIKMTYPILMKAPWTLPFVWVFRWFRYLVRNPRLGGGLGFKSYRLAKERIKLLEDYGLMNNEND
ncbi:MAG: nucleotidyltransferase family protein [Clostridia bacterium]